METHKLLEELSNNPSVSGYEHGLLEIIEEAFSPYVDSIEVDKLGNIICFKKGNKYSTDNPKIMLAAHMDEIGLMINHIDENGLLGFTNIGGIDPRTIVAQEVTVHGSEKLFGVIASKPPHLQDSSEGDKAIKMEDMSIDLGLSREKLEGLVEIGDVVTINRQLAHLKNNRVTGRALDNKAGVASLYQCAKELASISHEADVYYVTTVQEEVTMAGAMTATYAIDPDIGIAVDVGFGRTPELADHDSLNIGGGPGITLGGNIHPGLRKHLVEIASEYNIDNQIEVEAGPTGTDGRVIQITRAGVATLVLSIPLRYMHTSVEIISMKDLDNTGKLLSFFINSIKRESLEGLLCY